MRSLLVLATALGVILPQPLYAQSNDFLSQAVALAREVQQHMRIPASVILAQSILETSWGRDPIAPNNYFSLKAFEQHDGSVNYGLIATGWTWVSTPEWDGSKWVSRRERFRVYQTMADSFHDLGRLYTQNDRYAAAMHASDDPRQFAREIAAAGFATDPAYGDKLVEVMDKYNLFQYDLPRDDAQFLSQSEYPVVEPGQIFDIFFQVKNSGYGTWRAIDGYSLRNTNGVLLYATPRRELDGEVAPDGAKRWDIRMIAPGQPGTYRTEWRLYRGDQPFGPEMYADITVSGERVDQAKEWALPLIAGLVLIVTLSGSLWLLKSR